MSGASEFGFAGDALGGIEDWNWSPASAAEAANCWPSNRTAIRIVGMSRSGNHAVINWILRQLPGRWCFLNCVEPKSGPFQSARPTDSGVPFETNIANFDLEAERRGRRVRKDHILFSQEDTFLGPALGQVASDIQGRDIGGAERWLDVVILRDPYNLFASRRRFGHQFVTDLTAVKIWKQHARAYLGEWKQAPRPILPISFNRWSGDRDYRRQIARRLGLQFTDAGREDVAACGGGSSFDGHRHNGRASAMAVQDRWRCFERDGEFWKRFDEQVQDLSKRAFGPESVPAPLLA